MTITRDGNRNTHGQDNGGYPPCASIAEQLGLVPERVDAVIDLSNPGPPRRGGHDPLAPQVLTRLVVTGRLRIGHTADFADLDAPIIIREADDKYPGSPVAEGRCRSCIARPFTVRGEDETIMVLQHQPGCPEMDQLLRLAGAR